MPTILVLMGHPDTDSFTAEMARAYTRQAERSGARVTYLDLVALNFDLVLRQGYAASQALEPDLVRARDALLAADHVVFAFPMWWTATPALVKGFVDRVFTPGFAFAYRAGKPFPARLLAGRSARVITSMDAPSFWYTFRMRRALHISFVAGTLSFVGIGPTRCTTFYGMRQKTPAARSQAQCDVEKSARDDLAMLVRQAAKRKKPAALARFPASNAPVTSDELASGPRASDPARPQRV